MAAPAPGTVVDGYRFKGGDPKVQANWAQVAPIPAGQGFPSGSMRYPDGSIWSGQGPRGGAPKKLVDAQPEPGQDADVEASKAQATSIALNLPGATQAERDILAEERRFRGRNPLNANLGNSAAEALNLVPDFGLLAPVARAVGGRDWQRYEQARRAFEGAFLPLASGMAVTESEARRFVRANQPQLNDSPEILRRKAFQRQSKLQGGAKLIRHQVPTFVNPAAAVEAPKPRGSAIKPKPAPAWMTPAQRQMWAPLSAEGVLRRRAGRALDPQGSDRNPFFIRSDAEYDALPRGARYVTPDGQLRPKP